MKRLAAFYKAWVSCLSSLSIGFAQSASGCVLRKAGADRVHKELVMEDLGTTARERERRAGVGREGEERVAEWNGEGARLGRRSLAAILSMEDNTMTHTCP